MSRVRRYIGTKEYKLFLKNDKLTHKQAVKAMCYECMSGFDNGREDCMGKSCPLYQHYPYKGVPKPQNTQREGVKSNELTRERG